VKASVSKVNCALRCLQKYKYRYIENIEKIYKDARPQLGVIGHKSLEYYLSGKDWTAPIAEFEAELRKMMAEERSVYAHIPGELYRMIRGYINHWKKVDSGIKTIAVELPFEVKTPKGNTYEGVIDWVYEDAEGVWICDHKFMKQIPNEAVRYLDAQTNLYFYAARGLGFNPIGVVFDYIRTKPPTQPKILKNGTVSKADIDTDVETYLSAIRSAGLSPKDYMDVLEKLKHNVFYKRTKVPKPERITKNILDDFDNTCNLIQLCEANKLFPRSMNLNCSWDCEYSELCFTEYSGVDSTFIREANYKQIEKKEGVADYGENEQ
jgi:hypothetical protein